MANTLIYRHVRASTGRFQGRSVSGAPSRRPISRREIVLLRHMVILFCVFTVGWGPSMIADIVSYNTPVNPILYECATINFQLALLGDIIDLFLYNHEVRKYLTGLCLPRC